LAVAAHMSRNHPLPIHREKTPRYLRLAEWLCYLVIVSGPLLASRPSEPDAPRLPRMLLGLGVLLLGIIGLAVVMGRKHRPSL